MTYSNLTVRKSMYSDIHLFSRGTFICWLLGSIQESKKSGEQPYFVILCCIKRNVLLSKINSEIHLTI